MDFTGLFVQVISGAIGGSAAGAAAKDYSLGTLGNAIAGAIGGGIVGQLAPGAARALDARFPVTAAEVRLDALQAAATVSRGFVPSPKFPAVTRDIAAVLPRQVGFGEVVDILRSAKEPLLAGIEPFDIFTDDTGVKLPIDRKSLAFSLTFRSSERTLTTDEVNAACDRLRGRLREQLGIEFRE